MVASLGHFEIGTMIRGPRTPGTGSQASVRGKEKRRAAGKRARAARRKNR